MSRFMITPIMGASGKCVIFDSKLGRSLGNGKGQTLVVEDYATGVSIARIMLKRVGV